MRTEPAQSVLSWPSMRGALRDRPAKGKQRSSLQADPSASERKWIFPVAHSIQNHRVRVQAPPVGLWEAGPVVHGPTAAVISESERGLDPGVQCSIGGTEVTT